MIDYKQIFSEFLALESIQENKKTFNVISLPFMKHKLGVSNERFPMFFIGAPDKPCGVGRADANPKLLLNDT